jgi:ABC-type transport system involved in multi-copper enzyme maturation permease subunit
MTVWPIIARELRGRARQPATRWVRWAIGFASVLVGVTPLLMPVPMRGPATTGQPVFFGMIAIGLAVCVGACLAAAAGLSAERREGTLGLLLLTRVRTLDLLLGKFGSGGLTSVLALLSLLPVFMIALLAGGVTGGEAWRSALALLNGLFLALAVGLFAAASAGDPGKAIRRAVWLLVLVQAGPFLLYAVTGAWVFAVPSLLFALHKAGDIAYRASPAFYWGALLAQHLLGWGLLIQAGRALRRTGFDSGSLTGEAESPGEPVLAAVDPRRRPEPLERESVIPWLVRRQRGIQAALWCAALLGVLHPGAFLLLSGGLTPRSALWYTSLPTMVLGLVSGCLIAWAASRFFIESRRTGVLELLLTTPLGAEHVLFGQRRALRGLIAGPLILLGLPHLAGLITLTAISPFPVASWKYYQLAGSFLSLVNMVLGVWALLWVGLWFGLKGRTQVAALGWTVGFVKGVPYLLSLLLMPLVFWLVRAWGTHLLVSMLMQCLPTLIYLGLIRAARCLLVQELARGTAGENRHPAKALGQALLSAAGSVQKLRHWTPAAPLKNHES